MVTRDQFENQWSQIRPVIREKWSKLTEEDIRAINGRYEVFISKLQERYGFTRDEAEEELRDWSFDRSRAFAHERGGYNTQKADTGSFLKWALLAGIPLLLLAGFLASRNHVAHDDPYATTSTRTPDTFTRDTTFARETTDDRLISQRVHKALEDTPALETSINNIVIVTSNGVVTISGTVPSTQERDSIIRLVRNVSGVRQINNQIQVR